MRKPPQIVDFITLGERVISSVHTPQNPATSAASGGSPRHRHPGRPLGVAPWPERGDGAQGAWWATGLLPEMFVTWCSKK